MPRIQVNSKFEKFMRIHRPIKVLYGGRDSGKSIFLGDFSILKMETEAADIYCLREFQDSINDSVHKVFTKRIKDHDLKGWQIQKNEVISPEGARTAYKGASRNPDTVKSAQDYKYSWFEEAQKISQASLDDLLPTIIRNPGAECWFSGNPYRSSDPFSQRFIIPFLKKLNTDGFYLDDLYLIIKVNWRDNPWYWLAPETELLRKWDYENLSRAKYNWIWEGDHYDGVEDSLILPEWFDACVDAHVRLGFEARGIRMAAFDPADTGDAKAFGVRHGSVVLDVQQSLDGDVSDGCKWACALGLAHNVDGFTWDCDGIGAGLKEQIGQYFYGKQTNLSQFKGSEGVDFPDAIFNPILSGPETALQEIQDQLKNKDALKNKRAQYYADLQAKVFRTYEAVTKGKYCDPDKMISFSSKILALQELKTELCTMPVKPNRSGLFELYTKREMKDKFKVPSPNMADVVMMMGRVPKVATIAERVKRPPLIPQMGKPMRNLPMSRRY